MDDTEDEIISRLKELILLSTEIFISKYKHIIKLI